MTKSQREVLAAFAGEVLDVAKKYGMNSLQMSASKVFVSAKRSTVSEEIVHTLSGTPDAVATLHASAADFVQKHRRFVRRMEKEKRV